LIVSEKEFLQKREEYERLQKQYQKEIQDRVCN